MRVLRLLVASWFLWGCGGSETVAAHLPQQPPMVRIQVAVPEMYKGLPLTITAEPLPVPMETTVLGALPNQYEFDLEPEDLPYGTFEVLSYNPQTHTGMIVGDVDVTAELAHFDVKTKGTPAVVAFLLIIPSQVVAPRIDQIVVQWRDGTKDSFTYN